MLTMLLIVYANYFSELLVNSEADLVAIAAKFAAAESAGLLKLQGTGSK